MVVAADQEVVMRLFINIKKMTRPIIFLVSGMLLLGSGSAFSEILKVKCIDVKTKNEYIQQFNFDLKNKSFTTLLDNNIDIAFTDNEIVFQSYLPDTILIFEMNRENGKGSVKTYDYELKKWSTDKLHIEFAHSHIRYPTLSDKDKSLFAIRDYARKYFKPTKIDSLQCSKL
jgi:hypothetical protein